MKLSPILEILEDTWSLIQLYHPEVPDVTISIAPMKQSAAYTKGTKVVIGDSLLDDPPGVLGALIHEAVHQALHNTEGTTQPSHNMHYRKKAIEFGLDDEQHQPRKGTIEITPLVHRRYELPLQRLEKQLCSKV